MSSDAIQKFIEYWSKSGGSERSNYQRFLNKPCDVLDVPGPDAAVEYSDENAYVFDRSIEFINPEGPPSTKFIDLYKRNCFVLETEQSVEKLDHGEFLVAAAQARKKKRNTDHGTLAFGRYRPVYASCATERNSCGRDVRTRTVRRRFQRRRPLRSAS